MAASLLGIDELKLATKENQSMDEPTKLEIFTDYV
jgi:hypothetical protein